MTRARDIASSGGLVLISSTTIGTAVSSVTVNNAFSATYDAYRIIVSGGVSSSTTDLQLSLGGITTGYYTTITYQAFGSNTILGTFTNNQVRWNWAATGTTAGLNGVIDLQAPNLAKYKVIFSEWNEAGTTANSGVARGFNASTVQATDFTLTLGTGTMTGGTIKIYGYKN